MRLPELVANIEAKLENDHDLLDKFHERLVGAGYQRQLESQYVEFPLEASQVAVFKIDDPFPKIVENSFKNPPDHRISNIRYTLQLTGLTQLGFDDVAGDFKKFVK